MEEPVRLRLAEEHARVAKLRVRVGESPVPIQTPLLQSLGDLFRGQGRYLLQLLPRPDLEGVGFNKLVVLIGRHLPSQTQKGKHRPAVSSSIP